MTTFALSALLSLTLAGFEPNLGQAGPDASFVAREPGFALAVAATRLTLLAPGGGAAVQARLPGANPAARSFLLEAQPETLNYLRGNDPACWLTAVPTYARAGFIDVWPGIDLLYYQPAHGFEFDFLVAPGADASRLKLAFDDARALRVDADGTLIVEVEGGELRQAQPVAWQEAGRHRNPVTARWQVYPGGIAAIELGRHDPTRPLLVDPTLTFSTFNGGTAFDQAWDVAVDAQGFVYVVGETTSLDFPVLGAAQPVRGGNSDAFLTKLDPGTSTRLWSTYIGGNGDETGYSIAVDGQGRTLVAGQSYSSNFPTTPGVYQSSNRGLEDAFFTLLDASGSAVVFSTLLGGAGSDYGFGAGWDGSGGIVVAGSTGSFDWPTVNPLKPAFGGASDGFVARLSGDGTQLLYSTWLGGSLTDDASYLAIDGAGHAVVLGSTESTDLSLVGPIQAAFGGGSRDLLVARIDPIAGTLLSSTYLGGSGLDRPHNIAIDPGGNILLVGSTDSTDFPLAGALRVTPAAVDGVLARLPPDAGTLLYSTYLGGTGADTALAVAGDATGNLYVGGGTDSVDFPQVAPLQPGYGGGAYDAWAARIDASGLNLVWSSWVGGAGSDDLIDLALDGADNVWLVGRSNSDDFPVVTPVQSARQGDYDATVVRISEGACALPARVGNTLEMAKGGGGLFARFRNVAGALEYRIYEDTDPRFPAPVLIASPPDGPTGYSGPLPVGPLAFWTVRAANACGEGPR